MSFECHKSECAKLHTYAPWTNDELKERWSERKKKKTQAQNQWISVYERKAIKQPTIEITTNKKSQLNSLSLGSSCSFPCANGIVHADTNLLDSTTIHSISNAVIFFLSPICSAFPKNWMDYFFSSFSTGPATGKNSCQFFFRLCSLHFIRLCFSVRFGDCKNQPSIFTNMTKNSDGGKSVAGNSGARNGKKSNISWKCIKMDRIEMMGPSNASV